MNILTIDVGTSSMRGVVISEKGRFEDKKQIPYSPDQMGSGIVEQDPSDWENALVELLAFGAGRDIGAVALTAPRSSVIPVDKNGSPLMRAVMWQDVRQAELLKTLESRQDDIKRCSGAGLNTVFSGGKMAWIAREKPEIYQKCDKFFIIPDYLFNIMCGTKVTDHTYGSRTLLMDLKSRSWSSEMTGLFGIDADKLCDLVPPSSVVGGLCEKIAKQTGLKAGIPVITCGGDQQCGALGQGAFESGTVSINMGTGGFLVAACDSVPEDTGMICNASAIPGKYILESDVLSCGSAVNWFLRNFCPQEGRAAIKTAMAQSRPGAGGVRVTPYFQGRSNPEWDADARACFAGISLSNTKNDLLRGLLEGLCVEISRHIGLIEKHQPVNELRVGGGLSKSAHLIQLLADVSGKKVVRTENPDATVCGAWMSAAVCLKLVGSFKDAYGMIRQKNECAFVPDETKRELYRAVSRDVEQLYVSGKNK